MNGSKFYLSIVMAALILGLNGSAQAQSTNKEARIAERQKQQEARRIENEKKRAEEERIRQEEMLKRKAERQEERELRQGGVVDIGDFDPYSASTSRRLIRVAKILESLQNNKPEDFETPTELLDFVKKNTDCLTNELCLDVEVYSYRKFTYVDKTGNQVQITKPEKLAGLIEKGLISQNVIVWYRLMYHKVQYGETAKTRGIEEVGINLPQEYNELMQKYFAQTNASHLSLNLDKGGEIMTLEKRITYKRIKDKFLDAILEYFGS